jgi:cyanophycin synthetase
VLREPTVTAAVLETARGGILRRGIYVDRCSVAALLNVAQEQVGIDGIETLEEMARLKRKVIETARDGYVLNAGDEFCRAIAAELPRGKTILFSLDPATPFGSDHVEAGGRLVAAARCDGKETISLVENGRAPLPIVAVDEIPATFGGSVRHNVDNALAATALALAMNIDRDAIATALRAFAADIAHSAGRFNLLEGLPVRVLVDTASNPPALRRALAAAATISVSGRRIIVLASPGNRPDEQIRDMGRAAADHASFYVCMERTDTRRGRREGEIAQLIRAGLVESGVPADRIRTALTQEDGIEAGIALASGRGDLLSLFYTDFKATLRQLDDAFASSGPAPRR